MDFKQLEYFVTLANTLNFTKASETHFITQSTLSRQIKALEDELGVSLFNRTTHAVALTAAGELYFDEATQIILSQKNSIERLHNLSNTQADSLRCGYLGNCLESILPGFIRDYRQSHPGVKLTLRDYYNHSQLLVALEDGMIDVTFMLSTSLIDQDFLTTLDLASCGVSLITHPDNPLAIKKTVSIAEMSDEPLLFIDRSSTWFGFIVSTFVSRRINPHWVHGCSGIANLMMMVMCGYGSSLVSSIYKSMAPADLVFVDVEEMTPSHFIAAWRKENLNPALPPFIESLKTHERAGHFAKLMPM